MSVILICRKFLEVNLKPKLSTVINRLKFHTNSYSKIQILKNRNPRFLSKRCFTKWFKKTKQAELKIIDNIPDSYELIYRSTLERYIFYTQLGTSITTVIIVLTVILLYGSPKSELTFYGNTEHKPSSDVEDIHLYVAFFFTGVVLLQLLISRLPLRIYYLSQQKKYIFIFPSNLPFQSKRLLCKIGEVEKLPLTGILPWKDARFKIKNEHMAIMVEENFKTPADLYIMLGVQRDPNSDE